MKKYTALFLLLLALVLVFTSCAQNGLSAYEIARKNGYTGSEAEWLASLAGRDGANGADGKDGKDGKDGTSSTVIIDGVGDAHGPLYAATVAGLRATVSVQGEDGRGAGVVYRLDAAAQTAYILTNHHVIYNSTRADGISRAITVRRYGEEATADGMEAVCIAASLAYDVALLRVENARFFDGFSQEVTPPASYAVGESAVSVGNPNGDGLSATSGIVGRLSEYLNITGVDGTTRVSYRVMRINNAINVGNSGGGLFNTAGEWIGIVNARSNKSADRGIGYAIPASVAAAVAENMLANAVSGGVAAPLCVESGLTLAEASRPPVFESESGNITLAAALSVKEIGEGIFAASAREGDVLLSVKVGTRASQALTAAHQLADELLYARAGDTVILTVLRGDECVELKATLSSSDFAERK